MALKLLDKLHKKKYANNTNPINIYKFQVCIRPMLLPFSEIATRQAKGDKSGNSNPVCNNADFSARCKYTYLITPGLKMDTITSCYLIKFDLD